MKKEKRTVYVTSQVDRNEGVARVGTLVKMSWLTFEQLVNLVASVAAKIGHLIDLIKSKPYGDYLVIWIEITLDRNRLYLNKKERQFARLLEKAGMATKAVACSPFPNVT